MAIYSSEGSLAKAPPRSSRGARGRAIAFMTIALLAGSASAWMVVRYVGRHAAAGPSIPMTRVVVAAADIPAAAKLTPDLLKTVDWPEGSQPRGSFEQLDALAGRVSGAAIVAGEPIVEARLSAKGSGAGMASLIPANMRAMTVPVNEVVGVGGFIHPGDLVDVITTMQEPMGVWASAGQPEFRSKIVLQSIRVLAVGQRLASESEKPEQVPVVTLLVSPEEAERLALASTQGKLQLTMRSPSDGDDAETSGVSPRELLGSAARLAPAPSASASAEPVAARLHRPHHAPKPLALTAAPTTHTEVVEVLRGDRVEQKKVGQ
ncbi:Flp pilus assembly protein CpaB [Pendulispora brunnea]|uniref:Flp pilus assembly protein CpaB n=1 Tax=Pendulispora brunnea TaxID=2905690 RepID=A0ABZ2K3J1_9BACT